MARENTHRLRQERLGRLKIARQRELYELRLPPAEQPYGTVAVFEDLYDNLWDLVQFADRC